MLYNSNFSVKKAVANYGGAMEADTIYGERAISKHGRISKSQTSRINQLKDKIS